VLEEEIAQEMESRYQALESLEIDRLKDEQDSALAEREEQLRHGIRTRLEQQVRQRLHHREAALRAEYARRSQRLEADLGAEIQQELEVRLRQDTDDLEQRMREDVELAIARRRDELRHEVEQQLEQRFAERLSDRKARLRERFDLSYGKAIDEVETALRSQVETELEASSNEDFERYREARESEIQNRLARFRYEREAQLREELEAKHATKREEWTERLELEFQSREAAARKAIMSEVDASLRNERLAWDTDLDLLKEETVLELELDMEERLNAFRERKLDEVATQLERQLDKREEIMRNKALIDVRRKEARIRAEIEAQLGLKRAEIRDRISGLSKKMDEFKAMAEDRMRESITSQVEGEIATDEATLAERESEMRRLQSTDQRIDKRQQWLASISGQGGAAAAAPVDAAALGARPDSLGASAGRSLRGPMAQAAEAQQPRMGLAGMRAPTSSARALAPSAPAPVVKAVKQVKTPMVAPAAPVQSPVVPLEPEASLSSNVVSLEPAVESVVAEPAEAPPAVEPSVSETDNTLPAPVDLETSTIESVLEDVHDEAGEAEMEAMLEDSMVQAEPAVLPAPVTAPVKPGGDVIGDRPILMPVRTLHALGTPRPTAQLKPAMPVLSAASEPTVLQPVTTMNPRQIPPVERLEPADED